MYINNQFRAVFFENIVNESTANPRMLILHEVMGRDCGYLTAKTASYYRQTLAEQDLSSPIFPSNATSRDIHAIWIPELKLDLIAEGARLKKVMDENGCVNIFFGEGTGVEEIIRDMESHGEKVPRDAFGHVSLNKIKPGQYFSNRLAKYIDADKTIVQKSGYFARSAAANEFDRELIGKCAKIGVASAIAGVSGCMGGDEVITVVKNLNRLCCYIDHNISHPLDIFFIKWTYRKEKEIPFAQLSLNASRVARRLILTKSGFKRC